MKALFSFLSKSFCCRWFPAVVAVLLIASGGAWGQVEPKQLRARLLEQEPLLPEEVQTYDLNIDGLVDVADLRWLAITSEKPVCEAWVRGRLIDDVAGILVKKATITLKQDGQILASQADQLGSYQFADLQAGEYEIEVVEPSGIYLPATVPVTLDCNENVEDIHLTQERNLVLEAKAWYDSYRAGEQPTFPPEEELFDLVFVLYGTDAVQGVTDAELDVIYQAAYSDVIARVSEEFYTNLPSSDSAASWNAHIWLRANIDPFHFASLLPEARHGNQEAVYIDLIDNLLLDPGWHEAWLIQAADLIRGTTDEDAPGPRNLGSLISQYYAPRGRLGPTGLYITWQLQLYQDVPREFEHWETYYPQELLLELLGNELGPAARILLASAWDSYRRGAPDTGPGSVEELDEDGLETGMDQIDAAKDLENEEYLAWLLEADAGAPEPEQTDIVAFLQNLQPVSTTSAPWGLYMAYLDSIDEFMSSPVPILPGAPDADTLAIQLIFDAYRWVRSATPGNEGGDLNPAGLRAQVQDFADLYIRAFGDTLDSRDIFGEDSLPGVDTPYSQRSAVFAASPELWETWHDSYTASRDASLAALWSLSAIPTGTLVPGSHVLSPSLWQDSTLELNSFQQRLAHLAMAYYLYEYAALEHRQILFDPKPVPLGPGLPPNPSGRMKELVKWYAAALTLATEAHGGDNWTAGGLAVADVRLYAFLRNETEILRDKLTQALELTTQGLDPWGLLKRPFSTVEPDRLKEILQETLTKWDEWEQQDQDTALLDFEVERTRHMSEAARFDVLAAQFARDAAKHKLDQARAMRGIEALRLQLADLHVERAAFHKAAADLYAQAQAGQLSVQELKHKIAENKHEMLKRQAEVLKEQLDKVHDNVVEAMESAVPILRDANATLTEFINQYHDKFQKERKARPWWKKLFDNVKKVVGDISEAICGFNLWERLENIVDMGKALVTGDFDSAMQLWGKMTKENINNPLFKEGVKMAVKAKFKVDIPDEMMDAVTDGYGELIDAIVPQDTEQLRQYLIDEFLFEADDPPSLANDLMSNLFAERLVDLGVGYALVMDELKLFAADYSLGVNQPILEVLAANLRTSTANTLKTRFPSDSAAIDTAMADLASSTEIVSIGGTLEQRLFRSVVARDVDPNEVILVFIEVRKSIVADLAEALGVLSGWNTAKATGLSEAWKDFVKERTMAVIDREERSAQTLSKSDILALLPQETLDSLNTVGLELRKSDAYGTYLNDQAGHEQRMNANAKLYADVNTEDEANANRDAHIQEFKDSLLGLTESLNVAQSETVKVQNELVKIQQGAYEQRLTAMVEEKLVGVEQDLAGAKQMEMKAAATSVAMAETEREVAAQQLEVAELIITEREAVLAGLEQELLAQQARAAAANAEETRALAEEAFHAKAEALNLSQAWYWRRMARDTAQEIVFRGMFDLARTVDLLRGTNLLSTLKALDVQSPEQAQVALEIFDLMLFKNEVAQVYNIILSEADTTPGAVVASVALGAEAPPDTGLVAGTFEDAEVLPARDGARWLVWQLELLDGAGDLPEHFHPGLRNASNRQYHQLPASLMAGFQRIQVPVTGAGERKVFRALSVQPKIGAGPGPFNTDVHLVHLGDMWMNDQASPQADFALQWTAVAPVEFAPGGVYRLPATHTAFDIDFTNNQLYVALRPDPDPNARELASSEDYGANYPILGTWWVMAQRSYFQSNVHLRITFYAKSVFRLEQETQSAFTNAMNAMDKQVFETEILATAKPEGSM